MAYYFMIKDEKIFAKGQCKVINALNIEVTQDMYEKFEQYIYQDGMLIINPDYSTIIETKEKERISMLKMTRGDFFEGLILALGKDEEDVLLLIDSLELTDTEKKVYKNRVKNALDFYRGYPLVDVLASKLGITTQQMDIFFETKDYNCLITGEGNG